MTCGQATFILLRQSNIHRQSFLPRLGLNWHRASISIHLVIVQKRQRKKVMFLMRNQDGFNSTKLESKYKKRKRKNKKSSKIRRLKRKTNIWRSGRKLTKRWTRTALLSTIRNLSTNDLSYGVKREITVSKDLMFLTFCRYQTNGRIKEAVGEGLVHFQAADYWFATE